MGVPESAAMLLAFRAAMALSVVSYVVFASIVLGRRLVTTTHMKQVFFLCTSDCMVCIWEAISCGSIVRLEDHCWLNCEVFLPVLRTLQTTSILWTLQIAISMAFVTRGMKMPRKRWWLMIWPLALLLALPDWIATLAGSWEYVGQSGFCGTKGAWVNPDNIWGSIISLAVVAMLVAYANCVRRLCKIYNAVVARKLRRVIAYFIIFSVCYAPYTVFNGVYDIEVRYARNNTPGLYYVFYLFYSLTGFLNVCAYGYHHWDKGCWRRRTPGGRRTGVQVVMFNSSRESRTIALSTTAHLTSTASSTGGSEESPNCTTASSQRQRRGSDDISLAFASQEEQDVASAADDYFSTDVSSGI